MGRRAEAAVAALQERKAFVNASKTYAEIVAEHAAPNALDGIAETHLSHPTDSHPPLSVRLSALGISIKDVSKAALDVRPTQAAIDLLPNVETVEENISSAYQTILARQLGIDLESGTATSDTREKRATDEPLVQPERPQPSQSETRPRNPTFADLFQDKVNKKKD